MTFSLPARILAAAAVLMLLLVGVVVREDQARRAGVEARLPMEAVDPRGLLTGHYVALQLTQLLAPGAPCPVGSGIKGWIALNPSATGDRVAGAAATRAAAQAMGPVVIKGLMICISSWPDRRPQVSLDIGVSRFHVDQQQAMAIETALRRRDERAAAYTVVSVGRDGKARLKGVIIGNRRIDLDWR